MSHSTRQPRERDDVVVQTIDIVARLQARRELGYEAEQRLVDCILADVQFAASAPVAEIAGRAGVSEPTITRLARALGFAGTREMRFHLAQALALGGAYLRSPPLGPEPHASDNVVSQVCSSAHAALELMSLALTHVDFDPIVEPLIDARSILVCGTGGSSSMAAVELANRLFRYGLHVISHTDPQMQRMSASVADAGTALVGFSLSGNAHSVRDALSIAAQYDAFTLAVTTPASPLAGLADRVLPVVFEEGDNLYKPTAARYALLAVVDVLAMRIGKAIGAPALEKMRRVRLSLADQDIRDPSMPIGD